MIFIREDLVATPERFAMAFLVALGQSLLGNYALDKTMTREFGRGDDAAGAQ